MSSDKILGRIEDGIGHIVFNNPDKRNAVSLEMWQLVAELLDGYETDPAVRLVVLSGAGGKAFVSGADISKFESERASEAAVAEYARVTGGTFTRLQEFPKPTIAKINGYCVGGGVALAVCCDIRICEDVSKFSIPAAKLGLGYQAKYVKRLVDIVGPSFTKEIFFTARLFDAEEARMMGLVNRVVPAAELDAYVADYAEMITGNAPLTIAALKAAVAELGKDAAERDMARCEAMVEACFASQDYVEGRTAFMEKRKPRFSGT
ncbi:MAG: enoyl-CoA hydratase/isomerase family protein [Rhodospirillales bacterium]|nr:MAG: enoyl-CoA hydratase/isomerase family protein [Rhodospirillales bacterium]